MTDPGIPEWPHKPAPPEPRRIVPEWPLLSRGLALAAVGLGAFAGWATLARRGWLPALVTAPALAAVGVLAAWAAVIHLTGGEKFDDHPWV